MVFLSILFYNKAALNGIFVFSCFCEEVPLRHQLKILAKNIWLRIFRNVIRKFLTPYFSSNKGIRVPSPVIRTHHTCVLNNNWDIEQLWNRIKRMALEAKIIISWLNCCHLIQKIVSNYPISNITECETWCTTLCCSETV